MFNSKSDLLTKLSALRVLTANGFPSLKEIRSSLLSSKNDKLNFLLEVLKTLVGWETLRIEVVNFLTYQILPIESAIKIFLKKIIREHFFCNTDGLIPQYLIDDGFNVQIKSIDFFNILKYAPDSQVGKMIYGGTNDMNSFLWGVIDGTLSNWKSIVVVTYHPVGIVQGEQKNDIFNIKIHPNYTGLSINKFLNDFVDSVEILTLPLLMNRIMDNLYGVISLKMNKSPEQLKREIEFNTYVGKIIDLPDEIIDNSYYDFTKVDFDAINSQLEQKKNGHRYLANCGGVISEIPFATLETLSLDLESSTLVEINTLLTNNFDVLGESANNNVKTQDRHIGLLEFYYQFIKSIIVGLVGLVFSPKILLFFFIYFKIANLSVGFDNFKDFLLKNRKFIEDLIRNVLLPLILKFILNIILKEVKKLVAKDIVARKTEQFKYYRLALASLYRL